MRYPLMRSAFYDEANTKAALCEWLRGTSRLSMGPEVAGFEREFAAWQDRKHAIMVNSGSSANLLLLWAIAGNAPEGVGFSALTWATNVAPILQQDCTPVPIDVERDTLNISCDTVRRAYEGSPFDVLFVTHLLGASGDMASIGRFCDQHDIVLIEDGCEALGSVCGQTRLGNFGLASTFSFFVGHQFSTIEGGMICTDDDTLATMLRMARAHGWARDVDPAVRDALEAKAGVSPFYGRYTFYVDGYNLRPMELQGWLGRHQLPHLDAMLGLRERNAQALSVIYENPDMCSLHPDKHLTRWANFGFPIVCHDTELRDHYLAKAEVAGIETRPIVAGNMTRQPFYPGRPRKLPVADHAHDCGFYIGNHPELTDDDLEVLVSTFSERG